MSEEEKEEQFIEPLNRVIKQPPTKKRLGIYHKGRKSQSGKF
jgi:hypothetical protein